MQPYFVPTRKTTSKKNGRQPQKKIKIEDNLNEKMKTTIKKKENDPQKIKNEDNLKKKDEDDFKENKDDLRTKINLYWLCHNSNLT
jgi:hypothetical protein